MLEWLLGTPTRRTWKKFRRQSENFQPRSTLLSSLSKDSEDNQALYLLNQSLLENAFHRWEERVGPICDVNGLSGIYRYGFLPEIWQAEE